MRSVLCIPLFALFATASPALDQAGVKKLTAELWAGHVETIRKERAEEAEAKEVRLGDTKMRYLMKTFGEKRADGRSLYISMHGGGGGPAAMNDQQWRNQIRLYQPEEGIYLAPRAPGNTWNLWHTKEIDALFDRLIETLVVFENVNPNRVYLMGYSAGGDGVYQLAPRMSDRFAAAAMMAGHPNETSAVGLRNIPFALQVGALDAAYDRNKIAARWGEKLAELREGDPDGFEHFVAVREGKPHWMDLEDKVAVPWMAKFDRRRFPERVGWVQDDVTHSRMYWLALPEDQIKARQMVVASYGRENNLVLIETADTEKLIIRLNDEMLNLDEPVTVMAFGAKEPLFKGKVERSREVVERTFRERGDRRMVFSAEVTVEIPEH